MLIVLLVGEVFNDSQEVTHAIVGLAGTITGRRQFTDAVVNVDLHATRVGHSFNRGPARVNRGDFKFHVVFERFGLGPGRTIGREKESRPDGLANFLVVAEKDAGQIDQRTTGWSGGQDGQCIQHAVAVGQLDCRSFRSSGISLKPHIALHNEDLVARLAKLPDHIVATATPRHPAEYHIVADTLGNRHQDQVVLIQVPGLNVSHQVLLFLVEVPHPLNWLGPLS